MRILTAMTFDRSHVELYMTKFSFLTEIFLCVWASKNALLAATWSNIQQILCCVYV